MKKKKLTSLDILDGTVGKSSALSRMEMKQIMAGSEYRGVRCCQGGNCTDCLPYALGCTYYSCGGSGTCEEVSSC